MWGQEITAAGKNTEIPIRSAWATPQVYGHRFFFDFGVSVTPTTVISWSSIIPANMCLDKSHVCGMHYVWIVSLIYR